MDVLPARRMFRSPMRRRSVASRFLRETRADTALEFAFIGAAFFLIIFGIFTFALDMYWQMALDDAVRNAARLVQTGHITDAQGFRTAVCAEFGAAAPNCVGSLQFAVQSNTSFANIPAVTLSSAGALSPSATFNVTASTAYTAQNGTTPAVTAAPQFLLVRVAYLVPIKISAALAGVATENGTPALLSSVATVMQP